ncbi:methyltransferase domain-containing protein [Reichenbachiella versicolor]|uniref:methyltransferase domain-containing protein n=1 Tax=Reichenbachiella versicolor TaxID=1821036 RepID=UPI000D6E0AF6|nr:methyltransferase domain-containing protein [Reichenbachiella versicolor]
MKITTHETEIAKYYRQTQNHYLKWWNLKKSLSLHYGIWDDNVKSFAESLENTNKVLLETAQIKSSDKVLDAGCGVGGAAHYIHKLTGATVTGISLSPEQVTLANSVIYKKGLAKQLDFHVMNYCETSFENESFDVIWACESICHATNKSNVIKECIRLLKPSGKLIMCDYFLTPQGENDTTGILRKWERAWSLSQLPSLPSFTNQLNNHFQKVKAWDYTSQIVKSSKRMYYASILGSIPSELYNLSHPKVSQYAKNHYKSGIYQYQALKKRLWGYNVILASKR